MFRCALYSYNVIKSSLEIDELPELATLKMQDGCSQQSSNGIRYVSHIL
jgi:hypothetical protein